MKELIVFLSIFLSFGIGSKFDKRQEIFNIRELAESGLEMEKFWDFNGPQRFFEQMSGDDLCGVKVSDGHVSYYTKEVKKITKPIDDWKVQISKNVRLMDTYLKQMGINIKKIYETDFDFDNKMIDSFLRECDLPFDTDKRKRSINTNDIYEYQNLMNLEKEGTKDFHCGNGAFTDFNRTCDGNLDCWDGSDEFGACEETAGCEQCAGSCVTGPGGPECVASCPAGFGPPVKFCSSSGQCYSVCVRRYRRKVISLKCLLQIFPNLLKTTTLKYLKLMSDLYNSYFPFMTSECIDSLFGPGSYDDFLELSRIFPTKFPPTMRHPTWNPSTRHPTWHPTWHPTTRHPTYHTGTRHPTWHATTKHTTTTQTIKWDQVTGKSIWDSEESDNSTQFDENKPHTTKHHTTNHTTEHTTHHTTTPPTTTTTPTKTTSPTTFTTSDLLQGILQQ